MENRSFLDTLEKIPDPLYTMGGGLLSGIGGLLAGKTETEKLQEKLLRQRYEMGQKRGQYASRLQE